MISLAVGLVLVVLIGWHMFGGYGAPLQSLRVLSAREQKIVAACADASFPEGGDPALSGVQAGLVSYIDGHVASIQPDKRFLIRLLFVFIELHPWVFGPYRRRFTKLSAPQQIETLVALQTHKLYFLRVTLVSIRTLFCLGYMANPEVAERVGIGSSSTPFGLRA